jgi:dipeptidyl aminopeptidase/acylaminoacyl peptidase
MPSLEEHFRALTEIHLPDGWPDLGDREPRPRPESSSRRRFGVAVLALLVAAAGLTFAVDAFRASERTPIPSSTVENGWIAFSRGGSESGLYVVNSDGTGVTRLPSERGDNDAAWSPDGSRIAFVRYQAGDSGIYLMNADGTDVLQVTDGTSDASPTWSPDGTHIAFAREASGNADIYEVNADGTHVTRLTDDRLQESSPTWSPDGSRLAFDGWDDASGGQPPSTVRLYVMNEDGTGIRALGPENVAGAAWSPDGSEIAFADTEAGSIMTIHPDGTGERSIIDMAEVVGGVRLVYGPTWSPDSTKIAFFAGPDAAHTRIYVVNRDGSGLTLLTDGPAADAEPAWQPVPVEGGTPSPSPSASMPPPATPSVSTVALPDGLGATRVAIGEGTVWALASTGEAGSSVLVRIDPATDQVLAMTPLEAEPWYVAAGGGAVWVGSSRSSIQRVDSATNDVTGQVQLPGDSVSAIAADDQAVWVEVIQDRSDQGQQNLASLVRIDPRTNEVLATIPLDGFSGYDDEIAIGAGSVWVVGVNYSGNAERGSDLIRIDPVTNTIVATIPSPAYSVRAGEDAVWVTSPADGVDDSLHKAESWVAREIDPTTNEVSVPISLPGNLSGVLAVTAEGVWFSGYDDQGRIHPVRLQDGTFDASVPPIDSMYTDMAFDDASGTIWVAAVSGLERIDTR